MLSQKFATPLRLTIKHSPRLRAITLLFSSLCVLAILLAQMPVWLKAVLLIVMAVVVVKVWLGRPELGGDSLELVLRPNGGWLLKRAYAEVKLQLHGQSTISRAVMILVFDGGFSCILWRTEVQCDLYRKLQVYLRLYASEVGSPDGV